LLIELSAALYRGKTDEGYALSWQNKSKVMRTINAKEKRMKKKLLLITGLLVLATAVFAEAREKINPLAHTTWIPQGRSYWSKYELSFDEDTYVMTNVYGVAYSGVYAVSGNVVIFIGGGVGSSVYGKLVGGRLIIDRDTWRRD
jgi:hypothetical protein